MIHSAIYYYTNSIFPNQLLFYVKHFKANGNCIVQTTTYDYYYQYRVKFKSLSVYRPTRKPYYLNKLNIIVSKLYPIAGFTKRTAVLTASLPSGISLCNLAISRPETGVLREVADPRQAHGDLLVRSMPSLASDITTFHSRQSSPLTNHHRPFPNVP